ncbi:L,D-transpeptidase family protein [Sulfitobacter donghicola]|uniref:Peptidoglycan-binding protein n=1 Tax=Sulfitobacter donghicola DSW-25 = KCTC 12864 = JCM 14565 TaxID=1300350 RepID=A0A073IDX2_9RHOB|nr:L,D-transpeptidase family protein [Sulfitobacter donghicola]KEJ88518.1 peptidoglycan-binding protein [Sulfitobacter donghicola DSW-25 = KCTC 12864 = JCM 14565]KIN69601.1 Peptidoglycan binding protein [Sulfitobacter donghicola DSW-25 = KCTC 12864 = JCM 14565]
MLSQFRRLSGPKSIAAAIALSAFFLTTAEPVHAQVTAFKQAVAETGSRDDDIAKFYRAQNFEGIWTGDDETHRARRAALLNALRHAGDHGLPVARYDVDALERQMANARSARDLGIIEVEMTRMFLQYARDLQSGALTPHKVVSAIKREVAYTDRAELISGFLAARPAAYLRGLAPRTIEYSALMKQKMLLEEQITRGGWGPTVKATSLKPGASGQSVLALRNRLMVMGYLERSNAKTYDKAMTAAVTAFQKAHGLKADGVAGSGTIKQINESINSRLKNVLVAMERERWLNQSLGDRHILVNIPDFTAKIVDHGRVTFETRSVVGANKSDRPTPEFSDIMSHMVINPSWYVPRSIIVNEYLPALRNNPNAVRHIEITDSRGRKVNRSKANFAKYNARNFPYSMRQPPSRSNALGLVKFMFPNKYNIYLHDTPAKSLFSREVRAYSHGCVRLNDPFDFAEALLAKQEADPKGFFQGKLNTGREARVDLVKQVPVHIIYRTAFTDARGNLNFRRDVYGRDALIWKALQKAGVELDSVQG